MKKSKQHKNSEGANKSWLIEYISNEYGSTKVDAQRCLDVVTDALMTALQHSKKVSLIGFGSFTVQDRKSRKGRNPRTGQIITIGPYRQISFKAGSEFKDRVHQKAKTKAKA